MNFQRAMIDAESFLIGFMMFVCLFALRQKKTINSTHQERKTAKM